MILIFSHHEGHWANFIDKSATIDDPNIFLRQKKFLMKLIFLWNTSHEIHYYHVH